jgi:branched-chain amino acid transport system substrate-binding protein
LRGSPAVWGCAVAALALGASACGDDGGGGGGGGTVSGTTLTIYSSLPLTGASSGQTTAMVNGQKLALKQAGYKVGKFKIKFHSLDDSLASTGAADPNQGAQNARKAVQDKTTIAFIGAYNSGISKVEIPILNKAGILQVSPANTYVGLTSTRPGHEPGEPDKYYRTGKRNYARVVPADNVQGAALVTAAKESGCKSIHIWNSKTTYSAGLARNVSIAAKDAGVTVTGNDGIDIKAANYRSLAARIRADCFVFTGEIENNGVAAVKDVAAALPNAKLFGGDGSCLNDMADPKKGLPANVGARYKCTIATLDPATFSEEGKKFFADYKKEYKLNRDPDPYAIYGYEAMELVLDAIKRAGNKGNDRQAVIDAAFATKNRDSVLGTYSIDENGDTTLTDYGLYKVVGGKLVFDRVLKAAT